MGLVNDEKQVEEVVMNTELKDCVRDLALRALYMGCTVRLMDPGSSRVPQAYVTVSLDRLRGVGRNGDTVVEITSADGSKRRFTLDVTHVEASSGSFDSAADVDGDEADAEYMEYDEAASEIEGMLSDGAKIIVGEADMSGDVVSVGGSKETVSSLDEDGPIVSGELAAKWTRFLQDCVDCRQVELTWRGW